MFLSRLCREHALGSIGSVILDRSIQMVSVRVLVLALKRGHDDRRHRVRRPRRGRPPGRRASGARRVLARGRGVHPGHAGRTLPMPLYALWAPRMGLRPFTTTLVFAVYALGTVLALMAFASLSYRAGRRPLLLPPQLAAATNTALFLLADDVGTLLAARFLCGTGTGVFTATATAALGELAGAEHTRRVSTSPQRRTWAGWGWAPLPPACSRNTGRTPRTWCSGVRQPGPSIPGRHRHPGGSRPGSAPRRRCAARPFPTGGQHGPSSCGPPRPFSSRSRSADLFSSSCLPSSVNSCASTTSQLSAQRSGCCSSSP